MTGTWLQRQTPRILASLYIPPPIQDLSGQERGLKGGGAGVRAVRRRGRALLGLLLGSLPRPLLLNASRPLSSLVRSCSFNARDCPLQEYPFPSRFPSSASHQHRDVRDFADFFDPELGRCHTFNFNGTLLKYNSSRPGPLYGICPALSTLTT